jgi:hypothetical protein
LDNSYFLVIITLPENARACRRFFSGDKVLPGKGVFREPGAPGYGQPIMKFLFIQPNGYGSIRQPP